MSLKGKRVFYRTPDTAFQYKWAPENFRKEIKPNKFKVREFPKCEALPGTQGEDWTVDFVYKLVITDGQEHHYAYVECDYVK